MTEATLRDATPASPSPAAAPDLLADELALARAQLDSALPLLAEATLRRVLRQREVAGAADDELDAVRVLLAEALWRQQRPRAAHAVLGDVDPSSPLRREPLVQLVDAEGRAAAGERQHAMELMERLVAEIGVEAAWELRGGVPASLPWPEPTDFTMSVARHVSPAGDPVERGITAPSRPAARDAAALVDAARDAFAEGDTERAEEKLLVALRLDEGIAGEALTLLEPTIAANADPRRLVLYGDLLAALGRIAEADAAYQRAVDGGS